MLEATVQLSLWDSVHCEDPRLNAIMGLDCEAGSLTSEHDVGTVTNARKKRDRDSVIQSYVFHERRP